MKKLLTLSTTMILLSSLVFSTAYAGSGAGGKVRIINNSNEDIDVIWGGFGCFDVLGDVLFSCNREVIKKSSEKRFNYSWGVFNKWVSIGKMPLYGAKSTNHACGEVFNSDNKNCLIKKRKMRTKSWETTTCDFKEDLKCIIEK